MTTKKSKPQEYPRISFVFTQKLDEKSTKKQSTTSYRLREGGRTVGSGVVKEIIE